MIESTNTKNYADYLIRAQNAPLSRLVQTPYRLHIRKLKLGKTLDIGCGAGRNLKNLARTSVGIDHNSNLVECCQQQGLNAFTTSAFLSSAHLHQGSFDSILISHVAEHLDQTSFIQLLKDFVPFLKAEGRLVIICPQERGYSSDPTHIQFMDFETLQNCLLKAGFKPSRKYSFPFPRIFGKWFKHNEFVVIASH